MTPLSLSSDLTKISLSEDYTRLTELKLDSGNLLKDVLQLQKVSISIDPLAQAALTKLKDKIEKGTIEE